MLYRDMPPPRQPTRSFWRGPGPLVVSGLAVLAAVVAFALLSRAQPAPSPAPATPGRSSLVLAKLTSIPPSVYSTVGSGGVKNPLKPTGAATFKEGRPLVIYAGAEYCPFCAAERWSVAVALLRFGTFVSLPLTTSSSTDAYPDTPTFSFRGAAYQSQYLDFSAVEVADRQGNPLDKLSDVQLQAMSGYDPAGSIPFLDLGGRYYQVGAGYLPDLLAGSDQLTIATALGNPSDARAREIVGNADYLTAAICNLTGSQPAAVCADPAIKALAGSLG